jgi:hypothetical protein
LFFFFSPDPLLGSRSCYYSFNQQIDNKKHIHCGCCITSLFSSLDCR